MCFDSSGNVLGGLVVVEFPLHECAQIGILHDLHCLVFTVVSGHIRFVCGFLGIVDVPDFVMRYLVPDS